MIAPSARKRSHDELDPTHHNSTRYVRPRTLDNSPRHPAASNEPPQYEVILPAQPPPLSDTSSALSSDSDSITSSPSSPDSSEETTPSRPITTPDGDGDEDTVAGAAEFAPKAPLRARLSSFLAELKGANADLEERRESGVLDQTAFAVVECDGEGGVEREEEEAPGDGVFVEMDLRLGVLERVDGAGCRDERGSDGGGGQEGATVCGCGKVEGDNGGAELAAAEREEDVLGKLMGRKRRRRKPPILEFVDERD